VVTTTTPWLGLRPVAKAFGASESIVDQVAMFVLGGGSRSRCRQNHFVASPEGNSTLRQSKQASKADKKQGRTRFEHLSQQKTGQGQQSDKHHHQESRSASVGGLPIEQIDPAAGHHIGNGLWNANGLGLHFTKL
jgi:hypothetical protein